MVDFKTLTEAFIGIRQSSSKPTSKLKQALRGVIDYGREHPERYRLLFSNSDIAALGGEIAARRIKLAVGVSLCISQALLKGMHD